LIASDYYPSDVEFEALLPTPIKNPSKAQLVRQTKAHNYEKRLREITKIWKNEHGITIDPM